MKPFRARLSLLLLLAATPLSAQSAAPTPAPERPVLPWLVLGTFPSDSGDERVTRAYVPDEAGLAPSAGDVTAGRVWRSVQADSVGRLNFNAIFTDASVSEIFAGENI